MNKMQEIKIEKITLNCGVGTEGKNLDKSLKLLEKIAGAKPIKTVTKKRIPTWKVRPGLAIGCKVTIRGKKAEELLGRLLQAIGNKLSVRSFDNQGNISFGISEYLNIPDAKYDVDIGILGFEVATTLQRPGFRIKRRRIGNRAIPSRHQIRRENAIEFIKNKFNTQIGEKE